MSSSELDQKAAALRAAFDRSFAQPTDAGRAPHLDFLAIRVAGDRYALRLSEIASLHADARPVKTPSLLPELRGMASFRGVLTPVYDLAALLGYPAHGGARWLVLVQYRSPIALLFERFDAHLRVLPDRVSTADPGGAGSAHGALRTSAGTLPIVHLPSLVEGIATRIQALGPSQER